MTSTKSSEFPGVFYLVGIVKALEKSLTPESFAKCFFIFIFSQMFLLSPPLMGNSLSPTEDHLQENQI